MNKRIELLLDEAEEMIEHYKQILILVGTSDWKADNWLRKYKEIKK